MIYGIVEPCLLTKKYFDFPLSYDISAPAYISGIICNSHSCRSVIGGAYDFTKENGPGIRSVKMAGSRIFNLLVFIGVFIGRYRVFSF